MALPVKKRWILAGLALAAIVAAPFAWTHFTVGDGPLQSDPATLEGTGLQAYYGAPAALPADGTYPPLDFALNPYLDQNRSGVHEDTYNSDVTNNRGAVGRNPSVVTRQFSPWLSICPTVLFDSQDRLITACISPVWVKLLLLDPVTLEILAEEVLPRKHIDIGGPGNASGGGYLHMDAEGRIIVGPSDNTIRYYEVAEEQGAFSWKLAESIELNPMLEAAGLNTGERIDITDVIPDYEGRMWFTSAFGLVGYVDETTSPVSVRTIDLGADMQNQIAMDATGLYVVTIDAMNKLSVGASGQIELVWSKPYDTSAGQTGLVSSGSGTSPTLLGQGDDIVAITDNAADQLHLNLYQRETGNLVCSYPVFKPGKGGAENSPTGYGDEIVLANNFGFEGYLTAGNPFSVEPGLIKVSFERDASGNPIKDSCFTIWEHYEYRATPVPFFSTATGLIYTYSVHEGQGGEEAWYLNLIDWNSGLSVNRTWVGNGSQFDNITAQIAITDDGGAVITARNGLVLVRDN